MLGAQGLCVVGMTRSLIQDVGHVATVFLESEVRGQRFVELPEVPERDALSGQRRIPPVRVGCSLRELELGPPELGAERLVFP